MNLFHITTNAQGAPSFSDMRKFLGSDDKLMARIVRYSRSPVANAVERCAQMLEGLPSVLKFQGSRLSEQLLGNLGIRGFLGGGGVRLRTMTWSLAALALLAGCTQLPLDGPTEQAIVTGASATLANPPRAVVYDYAFVEINPVILDCLADVETDSFKGFGGPAPTLRVGAGDVLEASVFESTGGSVPATGVSNRLGNFLAIPRQKVSSSGAILFPYVGETQVAGRTVPEIEREVESKLANRVIEPQVILTVVEQNAGTVNVAGDAINASNRIPLSGSGERILDLISKAGGLKYPAYDTFVTLQRKNRSGTVYFPTLINNPEDNVFARPGDVIYVYRNQRKFVAAGAVGATTGTSLTSGGQNLVQAVGLFPFDQEHLSLNEALGKAGGLIDFRADPRQVFLYRMERRRTLEGVGVDLSHFAPNQQLIPTVYRADFRDPSSYLFAQRFPMRNKDTIYVGNADANEVAKVFGYITLWTGTAATVAANSNTVAFGGP